VPAVNKNASINYEVTNRFNVNVLRKCY